MARTHPLHAQRLQNPLPVAQLTTCPARLHLLPSQEQKPMPQSLKILCLSAEVDPFAKKGGLADVAGSLPKALHALGPGVRVVLPAYEGRGAGARGGRNGLTATPVQLNVPMGTGPLPA